MLTGSRRREFDGVVDGLVYAGFTAVGFAFVEDVGYIAQSFGQGTGRRGHDRRAAAGAGAVRAPAVHLD